MASAYIEYGLRAQPAVAGGAGPAGNSLHGACAKTEVLTISGSQATGAVVGGASANYARITTDTLCWVAVGTTPNTAATTATSATGSRRVMLANTSIDVALYPGQKVAVLSAP